MYSFSNFEPEIELLANEQYRKTGRQPKKGLFIGLLVLHFATQRLANNSPKAWRHGFQLVTHGAQPGQRNFSPSEATVPFPPLGPSSGRFKAWRPMPRGLPQIG